jgi:hypothetical protein
MIRICANCRWWRYHHEGDLGAVGRCLRHPAAALWCACWHSCKDYDGPADQPIGDGNTRKEEETICEQ